MSKYLRRRKTVEAIQVPIPEYKVGDASLLEAFDFVLTHQEYKKFRKAGYVLTLANLSQLLHADVKYNDWIVKKDDKFLAMSNKEFIKRYIEVI